jgi:uncharacterized Zn finger protein (UPF0148 family)
MDSQPSDKQTNANKPAYLVLREQMLPLTNYSLSTVCPSCNTPTYRHACKVRCPRCGFMWDCSEL